MAEVRRALLFVNSHKTEASVLAEVIRRKLAGFGIDTGTVLFGENPGVQDTRDTDVAVSLGGDGTVIWVARNIARLGIPIFPINIGTLGFIAVVHPDEWLSVFEGWMNGTVRISRRLMLEVTVERQGAPVFSVCGLNDAVISASGIAKIIRLEVSANLGENASPERRGGAETMSLGRYRSDGLIVATPTGSTGYSVAAGGPILDPEMEALIINPICPFTLSNRPIVVPADDTIIVAVEAEQRSGVLLTVDGQTTECLESGDRVLIRRAPFVGRIIASERQGFYSALRTKLNWSGGVNPNA
jgi:NAD+ kinase